MIGKVDIATSIVLSCDLVWPSKNKVTVAISSTTPIMAIKLRFNSIIHFYNSFYYSNHSTLVVVQAMVHIATTPVSANWVHSGASAQRYRTVMRIGEQYGTAALLPPLSSSARTLDDAMAMKVYGQMTVKVEDILSLQKLKGRIRFPSR